LVYTTCFGCPTLMKLLMVATKRRAALTAKAVRHTQPAIEQALKDTSVLVASRTGKVPDVGPSPRIGLLLIWD